MERPAYHPPILHAILSVSKSAAFLNEKVDEAIAPLRITNVQYNVLRILNRDKEKGVSRIEIMRQLIDKNTDLTRSINGLVKNGFVERVRTESDRRVVLHYITTAGIEALKTIDPLFYQMLEVMQTKMTEQEWDTLSTLCRKLMT